MHVIGLGTCTLSLYRYHLETYLAPLLGECPGFQRDPGQVAHRPRGLDLKSGGRDS
jgi:hypothetical protein